MIDIDIDTPDIEGDLSYATQSISTRRTRFLNAADVATCTVRHYMEQCWLDVIFCDVISDVVSDDAIDRQSPQCRHRWSVLYPYAGVHGYETHCQSV